MLGKQQERCASRYNLNCCSEVKNNLDISIALLEVCLIAWFCVLVKMLRVCD